MCAITEITKPGLKGRRVVRLNCFAVGEDERAARDGSPFAGGVEEGDVDV